MEILLFIVVCVALIIWGYIDKQNRVNKAKDFGLSICKQHKKTLKAKYNQLVYMDDYGEWQYDSWDREVDNFILNKIFNTSNELSSLSDDNKNSIVFEFRQIIHDLVWEETNEVKHDEDLNFSDYENLCNSIMEELGWESYVKGGSGDQGADVISEKNGIKCVIQCKMYSGSVGNKAVQEVFSAKKFYDADISIVVSTGKYTKGARQLASTLGTYLTNTEQLPDIIDSIEAG